MKFNIKNDKDVVSLMKQTQKMIQNKAIEYNKRIDKLYGLI